MILLGESKNYDMLFKGPDDYSDKGAWDGEWHTSIYSSKFLKIYSILAFLEDKLFSNMLNISIVVCTVPNTLSFRFH
jgi:hypothetical protein